MPFRVLARGSASRAENLVLVQISITGQSSFFHVHAPIPDERPVLDTVRMQSEPQCTSEEVRRKRRERCATRNVGRYSILCPSPQA